MLGEPRTSSVMLPYAKDELKRLIDTAFEIKPATPLTISTEDAKLLRLPEVSALIKLTNQHRHSLGLPLLHNNTRLRQSARWKCIDMVKYVYMAHDDPATPPGNALYPPRPPVDGRSWYQRVSVDSGYSAGFYQRAAGENLAYSFPTAQDVFSAWLSDIGHRQNIESNSWSDFGYACAVLKAGSVPTIDHDVLFWGQEFGAYAD